MRYMALRFRVKLDTNHQFTPTVDFFEKLINVITVYFRHPITILQCLKKSLH